MMQGALGHRFFVRGCFVAAAVAAACSSSDDTGTAPSLRTESHTVCVVPSTTPQDVALPPTGGISGTLSFDAFPAGATGGCDTVKISTGDSVEVVETQSLSPFSLHVLANGAKPKPILTISVGEGIDGNALFGQKAIVTGAVLNASPDLSFPDGTYYMTVTRMVGTETRVDVVVLTATNGELRVSPITSPNGGASFPVLIAANTTAILSLYAKDVIPPAADPANQSAAPKEVDVTDAGLPPLPPDPPHDPPLAGSYGNPPPTAGSPIGYVRTIWTPGCSGNPGCDLTKPISSGGGNDTLIDAPAGMVGTVTYTTNIGYMALAQVKTACPPEWDVNAGLNGSGVITIPPSAPFTGVCTITYSTVPPNKDGSGYEIVFKLRGLDIGAH